MLFNSYEFILLFLPVSLFVYYRLISSNLSIALTWLVASSLFFYGWWNPTYLALLITSILFNYGLGIYLTKHSKQTALIFGIIANLSLLAYYKYTVFFVDNVNQLLATNWNVGTIILPLAISFFTFQQITYLVDAYRSETHEYNFLHYCLFVTFFPQLIAGPIVHHKEMMPQFSKIKKLNDTYKNIAIGLTLFTLGLCKKVLIADTLAPYASEAFNATEAGITLSFIEAWRGALAYTFQLYFDFSGYTDMAIGIALMFGIHLPLNFNSPYKANNIIDFWQRWHMTLSRFLRDYVYIPLGGNRKSTPRKYTNILITMLIGGLWHGAAWTFVFWGLLHGLYIVINHFWRWLRLQAGLSLESTSKSGILFARVITFLSVIIAWVFFRAESFDSAIIMLKGMSGVYGFILPENLQEKLGSFSHILTSLGWKFSPLDYSKGLQDIAVMITFTLAVWYIPNTQEIIAYNGANKSRIKWRPTMAWSITLSFLLLLVTLRLSRVSEFLYFQF